MRPYFPIERYRRDRRRRLMRWADIVVVLLGGVITAMAVYALFHVDLPPKLPHPAPNPPTDLRFQDTP